MIALMMIFAGLPVIHGVIAMMMVGFLGGLFLQDTMISVFSVINDGLMWLFHAFDYFVFSGGQTYWAFANWFQLPERGGNEFVVWFALIYMAFEIITFATILIVGVRRGRGVPNIKQGSLPDSGSSQQIGQKVRNPGPF